MMWVENYQVPAREWFAVYYDSPEEVPAEKPRCATMVVVDEDYAIPANNEGVVLTTVVDGDYTCARARVVDYDFATPRMQFLDSLLQGTTYRMTPRPCSEIYPNGGNHNGYWDTGAYVPVECIAS